MRQDPRTITSYLNDLSSHRQTIFLIQHLLLSFNHSYFHSDPDLTSQFLRNFDKSSTKMAFNPLATPKNGLGYHRILAPTAGVRVSPLCLGAMNFGEAWYVHSRLLILMFI